MTELRILLLEDVQHDATLIERELRRGQVACTLRRVDNEPEFVRELDAFNPDLICADYMIPGFSGMAAFDIVRKRRPETPFILVSGSLGEEIAIEALKRGVTDYVLKTNLQRISPAVQRAVAEIREHQALRVAEEKVRESEQRFRIIFEHAGIGISLRALDRRTPWLAVNDKFCELTGYTREELLQSSSLLITPLEEDEISMQINTQLQAGHSGRHSREKRILRKDGSSLWVVVSVAVLNDIHGQPSRVIAAYQDITGRKLAEDELRERSAQLQLLANNVPALIAAYGTDGRYRYANSAYTEFFAPDAQSIVGKSLVEVVGVPIWHEIQRYIERACAGEHVTYQRAHQLADGRLRHFEVNMVPKLDGDGRVSDVYTLSIDVTDRVDREQRINRLNRILQMSSAINALIARVDDRQQLFEEACRIACVHGGFGASWIGTLDPKTLDVHLVAHAGLNVPDLAQAKPSARSDASGQGVIGRAIRSKKPAVENDLSFYPEIGGGRRKIAVAHGLYAAICLPLLVNDGAVAAWSLIAKERGYFNDEEIRLLSELAGNISLALDALAKSDRLEFLANYDTLTGLTNRTLFIELLTQACAAEATRRRAMAVMLLDVDRFRMLNDTFGRRSGDMLLTMIAERLKGAIFDRDTLARIGSNTFALLLREVENTVELGSVVEGKILGALNAEFKLPSGEARISARVGVAVFPDDGVDADALLSNAQAALDGARKSPEHYLFYAPSLNARVAERLSLENELRRAVEHEEFRLYYQPKIEIESGRVAGVEALLRWQHPQRGLISPQEFIPLLEETGLILAVGRWALAQASADRALWIAEKLVCPHVAVNVSAAQLRRRDFAEDVARVLGGGDGSGLCLEITESMMMEDVDAIITKLTAVRKMGFLIAIDDFGTGYSSLNYLSRLPVDMLKIDRAFVASMSDNRNDMTIVSAVIALARGLGLEVVAEGVETKSQLKLLRQHQCNQMQGYLCSEPLPANDIKAMFAADYRFRIDRGIDGLQ